MLNLPPEPGTTGAILLVLGALAGVGLVLRCGAPAGVQLGDRLLGWIVAAALAATVAGAPYTVWRVVEDIRETASIGPDHARFVGAETKLIDGELAERIGVPMAEDASYYVAVAPEAFSEIQESLAVWLGYALVPRRRVRRPASADWIVTWGATPAALGLQADRPRLVGRNRLVSREPVYVAPAAR